MGLPILTVNRQKCAGFILWVALFVLSIASIFLYLKIEPFVTYYFIFAWWSSIFILDSWLYLRGGETLFYDKTIETFTFLIPFSAFLWFGFEAFNLRLQNWSYQGLPPVLWIRWLGYFISYSTVLPALFVVSNGLDQYNIFRKNEFSGFFNQSFSRFSIFFLILFGLFVLILSLCFPRYFYFFIWVGFIFLLDPIHSFLGEKSLFQEWKQRNWNRTFQLLLAGCICGFFWEFWNFWAGAKWQYHLSWPSFIENIKIFEMPLLGFLGFPIFALECFVLTIFAQLLRKKLSRAGWQILCLFCFIFSLFMCYGIDQNTVISFR